MKIITSTSKRYPGTVVLYDPLTFPMVFAFENAIRSMSDAGEDITVARANYLLLPGLLACVAEWHLEDFPENVTPDTFPASPKAERDRLIAWLTSEVTNLFREAEDIPNE